MKVVALVQARMSSSRLPGKMLLSYRGYPILEWVLKRVAQAKMVDEVVLATSTREDDKLLVKLASNLGFSVYTGSLNRVLDRFVEAGKYYHASHVVRVCADNPLISGFQIDHLIEEFFKRGDDYVYNHIPKGNTYPDGLGAEMVSMELLEDIQKNVSSSEHQEHCLSYILDHAKEYRISTFDPLEEELKHPELKFDIDTLDDFVELSKLSVEIGSSDSEIILEALRKG